MTRSEISNAIKTKQSFLCVGLDSDKAKIPSHLLDFEDPIYEFNKVVIDATKDFCVAYKPNIAFYECMGSKGWDTLKKTLDYVPKDIFTIADAKRGDIGNTSTYYARTFFEYLGFDAVTVAPYMGEDSVTPFLAFENKWVILLALTSNKGALDFQLTRSADGEQLFEKVIRKSSEWGSAEQLMYVVGATRSDDISTVRKLAPEHFFLVPGVGAQGGSLEDVTNFGWNPDCGLLVNSSRGIIYAGQDENFGRAIAQSAKKLQSQMADILQAKGLI